MVDRVEVTAHPDARLEMQARITAGPGPLHEEEAAGWRPRRGNVPLHAGVVLGVRPGKVASVLADRHEECCEIRIARRTNAAEGAAARDVLTG